MRRPSVDRPLAQARQRKTIDHRAGNHRRRAQQVPAACQRLGRPVRAQGRRAAARSQRRWRPAPGAGGWRGPISARPATTRTRLAGACRWNQIAVACNSAIAGGRMRCVAADIWIGRGDAHLVPSGWSAATLRPLAFRSRTCRPSRPPSPGPPAPGAGSCSRRTRADLLQTFFALALSRRYRESRPTCSRCRGGEIDVLRAFQRQGRATRRAWKARWASWRGWSTAAATSKRPRRSSPSMERHLGAQSVPGPAARVVREALVAQVEVRLQPRARLRLPPRLAAHALADGMLSPVVAAAWRGRVQRAVLTSSLAVAVAVACPGGRSYDNG